MLPVLVLRFATLTVGRVKGDQEYSPSQPVYERVVLDVAPVPLSEK